MVAGRWGHLSPATLSLLSTSWPHAICSASPPSMMDGQLSIFLLEVVSVRYVVPVTREQTSGVIYGGDYRSGEALGSDL